MVRSDELRKIARKAISDAAASLRFDANETIFFQRQLEHIEQTIYEIKYPTLIARDLVPKIGGINTGAQTHLYREYDQVGVAKILSDYADDLPRADVIAKETTSPIKSLGASYGYDLQELRAASMANVQLDSTKGSAARRMIEEGIDNLLSFGSIVHGFRGLLNQTGTNTYVIPNGVSGFPQWSKKTSDEILDDLNGIAKSVVVTSNGVEYIDTIVIPFDQHALISTKPRSSTSDTTVLDFFLKNSPWVKAVIPWYRCNTAGSGGTPRGVGLRRDPEALGAVIPQEFEQLPVQQENLAFKIPCHARCGGVVVRLPLTIVYFDNF